MAELREQNENSIGGTLVKEIEDMNLPVGTTFTANLQITVSDPQSATPTKLQISGILDANNE